MLVAQRVRHNAPDTTLHTAPPTRRRTVGYFGVPDHNNTFYPMFHGNIYLFGTLGLSLNMWMSNFEEGALWLLVWGCFSVTTELIVKKQY